MIITFPINISWKIKTEWDGFSAGPYNLRLTNIPQNLFKLTEFSFIISVLVIINHFLSLALGFPFKQEDIPIRIINSVTGNNVTAGYRYTPDAFFVEDGVLADSILQKFQQNKYALTPTEAGNYLPTNYISLNNAVYFCGHSPFGAASIVYPRTLGTHFNITTEVNNYFALLTQNACQMAKQLHQEYLKYEPLKTTAILVGTVIIGGLILCGLFGRNLRNRMFNHPPQQPVPLPVQPPQPAPAPPAAQQAENQAAAAILQPAPG